MIQQDLIIVTGVQCVIESKISAISSNKTCQLTVNTGLEDVQQDFTNLFITFKYLMRNRQITIQELSEYVKRVLENEIECSMKTV